jgi:hypothetical protein
MVHRTPAAVHSAYIYNMKGVYLKFDTCSILEWVFFFFYAKKNGQDNTMTHIISKENRKLILF